jgi:hypothetical protein
VDFATNTKDNHSNAVKIELIRTAYSADIQDIKFIIDRLLNGHLLSECLGDESASSPPNDFLNLTLECASNEFVIRPEVFLPIEHALIPWQNKAIPSPQNYGCYVQQIFYLPKTTFIQLQSNNIPNNSIPDTWRAISIAFEKVTGLNVIKSSAPRIGNIEFYRFPFSKPGFEPFVKFSVNKEKTGLGKSVTVEIEPNQQEQPRYLQVRCRLIDGEEIALDEIRDLTWDNHGSRHIFTASSPISEVLLTIWQKEKDGDSHILYEKSCVLMRTISVGMSLIGTTINSGSISLLNKLRHEEKDEAKKLASFTRSSGAQTMSIGGHEEDPWVVSAREAIKLMDNYFPEKSEGRFFRNGWDEDTMESGQLSFARWVLDLISPESKNKLILIDPFFDKDGIELFSNARTTNAEIHVLTCTQHRSTEEESTTELKDTKAADDIRVSCRLREALLKGINLRINDLRSDFGGKNQLFHDRYVVITNHEGGISKGFHLSNSIQGATRKAPLLVTPIPKDILPQVLQYMEELVSPIKHLESERKTHLIQLYPFPKEVAETANSRERNNLSEIPNITFVLSKLLRDDTEHAQKDLKLSELKDEGFIVDGNLQLFKFTPGRLSDFCSYMDTLNQDEFNKIWQAFGEALAHAIHSDSRQNDNSDYDAWDEIRKYVGNYSSLGEKLAAYLNSFERMDSQLADRDRLFSQFNDKNFEACVRNALISIDHFHGGYFSIDFSYRYAAVALVDKFPESAVELLEELVSAVKANGFNEADSKVRAKLMLISVISYNVILFGSNHNKRLNNALLDSNDFSIRAFGAALTIGGLDSKNAIDQSENIVESLRTHLADEEYRYSVASFINDVYFHAKEDESAVSQLFEKLYTDWNLSLTVLQGVVTVLWGNRYANHSLMITEKLLLPLINSAAISIESALSIWNSIFLDKICPRNEYRTCSSDTSKEFSSDTDIELSNSLLLLIRQSPADLQLKILNGWLAAINPMWDTLEQPFPNLTHNFHAYAERIFWLQIIMKALQNSANISEECHQLIREFFDHKKRCINRVITLVEGKEWSSVGNLRLDS